MQDFFNIVGSFGFPVAVASYLLFRFEKKLEVLAGVNNELCNEIKDLKEKIVDLERIIKVFRKKK
jgi:hypothetical protein